VLAVIRQSVDTFRLGQASHEILDSLGRFRTQWERFSEHIDKVDRQLDTVRRGFDELAGVRRRQLERQLDAIDAIECRDGPPSLAAVDRDTG
jgi:DNA anti-recombination protein RmuC